MNDPPNLACERAKLQLSLRADGAATPEQLRDLDAHLGACAECAREAAPFDATARAVGDRLRERADGPVPAGFSARVVAALIAERAAAAAQNRILRWAAAAAVFVLAVSAGSTFLRGDRARADGDPGIDSARAAARVAVLHPRNEGR